MLICAHGRRDVCCAVRGRALAATVAETDPAGGIWESSHLGGHRFAPTALVLPTGYAYGRLDVGTALDACKSAGIGEVGPAGCRGHVGLDPAAQVAELAVREHTGVRGADELLVRPGEGAGPIEVVHRDGRRWSVDVRADSGAGARPSSCGAALEPVTPLVAAPPRALP